jgi:Flp pilus assembly pilin Flp
MKLAHLYPDDRGSSAVEHALILGIIGTVIILCAILLSWRVADATNEAGTCISSSGERCD